MSDIKKVTEKDTKNVILGEYNKALAKIKALESGKLNPAAELKEQEVKNLLEDVDKAVEDGVIENQVLQLKKHLTGVLDGIATSLEDRLKEYAGINNAIELKKAKLEELFGIEEAAFALVALINSKEEIARQYEEGYVQRRSEAEKELQALRASILEERQKIQKELAEDKETTSKNRKREEEEYVYNFNRMKQQKLDVLDDELALKAAEFKEFYDTKKKEVNVRNSELDVREAEIDERESKVNLLEETIASLQVEREEAIKDAVAKAKSDASSNFYRDKAMIEKEAAHTKELLESKIETLEAALQESRGTIDTLNNKLDKAQAEVREIATKTIDNAGDKKVIEQMERMVNQKNSN